ncbi:carboxypeptidase [Neorhizobium sp. S3-V5DH]|uniref:S10 family peptidase n=1 Tax=Neorhizobium sp. S3-V5DH TaxID=2485166 RepID=UPI0010EF7460|nr:carboxypeptidase [Neorhizobium sp. S3-V5DH]TCV72127.1 carboxypeptidase C (cathepsin A) [Neorhizobium sp. S3-V5DH]
MQFHHLVAPIVVLLALCSPVSAQQQPNADDPRQPSHSTEQGAAGGIFSLIPADATKELLFKGRSGEVPYTTTAGTLDLFSQDGTRSAKIFYTAYVAKNGTSDRPLTFVFNGGPGASSAYLHLGLVGPRILEFGETGDNGTTPALKDNPESWLAFTDLVLIDPVGTGWSRPASDDAAKSFYGVRQDADSLAKVIALYVQKNNRLEAPKYLLGESYGGFRAAKVAVSLKNTQGILTSGIIMLSPMIEGRFLANSDDPLSAALQLPSLAAAELERKNAFTPDRLIEVERFAMHDYLASLAGPFPTGPAADSLYSRVAELTGISKEAIARTRGFVGDIYAKQMAGESRIVSPYDASYAVPDAYPEDVYSRNDDPILDGYTRAYGSAFAAYARNELGFASDMTYSLLNEEVNRRWEWNGGQRGDSRTLASASTDIRDLLSTISTFRLMIAHGYSDALTPYGASRYVIDHLPPALAAGRTELQLYRGGHMFYTRPDSRQSFATNVRAFYEAKPSN